MAKITVEAAAKRLDMEPEDCIKRLQEMGIMVRDQLDKIDTDVFLRVKARLDEEKLRAKAAASSESKRIGNRVIRRRRVREDEEEVPAEAAAEEEAGEPAPVEAAAEAPAPEAAAEVEEPPAATAGAESAAAETILTAAPAAETAAVETEAQAAADAVQAPVSETAAAAAETPAATAPTDVPAPAEPDAAPAADAPPPKSQWTERPGRQRKMPAIETIKPKKLRLHDTTREPAKILSRPVIPVEPIKPATPEPSGPAGARPGAAPTTTAPTPEGEHRERKGRRIVDFGDRARRKDQEHEAGFLRGRKQPKKKKGVRQTEITTPKAIKRKLKLPDNILVGELAKRMGVKSGEIIKKLLGLGTMVTINQDIDYETAAIIAGDLGFEPERSAVEEMDIIKSVESTAEQKLSRPPVVTVMGHVDHGKTTLLDAIRHTDVAGGEAGGITQHIGAYSVKMKDGRLITFVDTPGHESFAAMRARGAQVTDIVVLVVAADDGVMPQTIESINHAKEAGVAIVVAVNKIDKDNADPSRITRQLMDYGLVPESLGGTTLMAHLSAKKREGVEELLEAVLLQSEIMELRADPNKSATAVILDARLERGHGPVVDVIVKEGTLNRGDLIVADTFYGRVRMMFDDKGQQLDGVGPGMPAQIVGLNGIPRAGMVLNVVADEKAAKAITQLRTDKARSEEQKKRATVRLEDLYARAQEGKAQELKVVIKCDVHGSAEAVRDSLLKLGNENIKVKVIHTGVGAITENDVNLASASEAIIIGFNVRPETKIKDLAEALGVEIKLYSIIYDLIQEVSAALEGMLAPTMTEVENGAAEVRNTFHISKVGTVAGCMVVEGKIVRAGRVRVVREGAVLYTGNIGDLKRFKDDAKEVAAGFECGINVDGFNDFQVGDRIESFTVVEEKTLL
jgi:translation initiation factor IF-2